MRFDRKSDTVVALKEGMFGNAPRQWDTPAEVERDVGQLPIVVRPRVAGGRCWYDVRVRDWLGMPGTIRVADYYFNEPSDPRSVTLNAEITRSVPGGVYMTYATTQQHMRPALRDAMQHAQGLRALTIMRHLTCDRGRAVIEDLMDAYPDHVIEFTCMTKPYGTLGWRTVVWEVRSY